METSYACTPDLRRKMVVVGFWALGEDLVQLGPDSNV